MLYKFKSKAAGDVIMLQAHGDELMRILCREPAAQGIFEVSAMSAAIEHIQAAIALAEQPVEDVAADARPQQVGLRQRLWPIVEMLRRARAADEPIVWGV